MPVKMYGPAFDGKGGLVERDVPDADLSAYQQAGYVAGTIPTDSKEKAAAEAAAKEKAATFAPAEPEPAKGKLPDDFPGHVELGKAGINTYAQLRKVDDVRTVPGIGEATAVKIAEALAEPVEKKEVK